MGITLGPGGRGLLVLLGLAVVYVAFDRAGWLPAGAPRLPGVARRAPAPLEPSYAWDRGATCARPVRVATTGRVAAARLEPGDATLEPVPTAQAALERLASGAVSGAVLSLSELAAGWELAERARPEVALEIAGTPRDIVLFTQSGSALPDLAGRRVAVVPGSAEEYRLMGALSQAGLQDRVPRQAAATPADAVARVSRGAAEAAVVAVQHVGQAVRAGQGRALELVAPLDPIVLVLAGSATGCAGEIRVSSRGAGERAREIFPDPGLSLQDALATPTPAAQPAELLAAWRSAAGVRGAPRNPPLALVVPAEVP